MIQTKRFSQWAPLQLQMALDFDPERCPVKDIQLVFRNPIAAQLYLAISQQHRRSEYFAAACLNVAAACEQKMPKTADEMARALYDNGFLD